MVVSWERDRLVSPRLGMPLTDPWPTRPRTRRHSLHAASRLQRVKEMCMPACSRAPCGAIYLIQAGPVMTLNTKSGDSAQAWRGS